MQIKNFFDSSNIQLKEQKGAFQAIEYQADLSLTPAEAGAAYYSKEMNVKKRQIIFNFNGQNGVILSAGAMQWMAGPVQVNTNVQGAGDLLGKMFSAKATGETAIKPVYTCATKGIIALEPSYQHLLLEDLSEWNGGIVMDDGLFLAADSNLTQKVYRKSLSSALTSGLDLYNMMLQGQGVVALESPVAREEIVEIVLQDETLTVDGDLVIAWSPSVNLTVQPVIRNRGVRGLVSSNTSGEGLVNVFRGTGKVLLAPTV